MAKYDPLRRFLSDLPSSAVQLGFKEIEKILGAPLPPSAHRHRPWWANSRNVQAQAWSSAGWRVARLGVDLERESVAFQRIGPASSPKPRRNLAREFAQDLGA